ncbi:glutaredoxin-C10 [Sesamum indicum]|uniref:Glutaredoxin-C10 n=1 Tax=Sesamum indicum TaxID=4182 RepID=A0A8M8V3H8_SESIN|nr:glutaredoxin-C10 [Sesamum indicum]
MCHVMKRLLSTIGVHPTVIELEEDEIGALSPRDNNNEDSSTVLGGASGAPALYIGGACVGGLESLVALHLSNNLVPKLVEVGALRNEFLIN